MKLLLKYLYLEKQYSIKKISFLLNKSRTFVTYNLNKYNIPISKSPYHEKGKKHPHFRSGPQWKGGRRITSWGYVKIRDTDHPFCDCDGYVFEHRLIMEKHLKRYLKPSEQVHHINGDILNNDISNLKLFKSNSEHILFETNKRFGTKLYNNKEMLTDLYLNKNLPIDEIASILKCHKRVIFHKINKFNIPHRCRI